MSAAEPPVAAARLDVAERDAVYVWPLGDGRLARVSAPAYTLLRLREEGLSFEEIAWRFGRSSDVARVAAAHEALLGRLDAIRRRPRSDRAFLVRVRVLSAARAAAIARRLAPLYRGAVALPLVVASLLALAATLPHARLAVATPGQAAIAFALLVASLFAHELGHASASSWFGSAPSEIGATLYLVYPAFYSDVSAAWTLPRRARVIVDVGGVYFQLPCIAALAAAHAVTGWAPLGAAAWMSFVSAVVSLNPIFRFDGYWLLADLLGVANLDAQPRRLAAAWWSRLRGRAAPSLPWTTATTRAIAIYGAWSLLVWAAFVIGLGRLVYLQARGFPRALALLAAHHSPADLVHALPEAGRALFVLFTVAWLATRLVRTARRR
jgi:putative peptide zinc metalloprotease protein